MRIFGGFFMPRDFINFCHDISDKAVKRGITPEKLAEILAKKEEDGDG